MIYLDSKHISFCTFEQLIVQRSLFLGLYELLLKVYFFCPTRDMTKKLNFLKFSQKFLNFDFKSKKHINFFKKKFLSVNMCYRKKI